jgi:hypothetical protein
VDQLHGYTLSSYATATAAEDAVHELTANPTAGVEAVEELDAAQRGPPARERRILRRYGYARSLRQDELLPLRGEFGHARLKTLIAVLHHSRAVRPDNRVTAYCERCVRMDPRRTFPLPPRREHDWP